jgi:uncharacterized protein YndB with AHSA1/START domain
MTTAMTATMTAATTATNQGEHATSGKAGTQVERASGRELILRRFFRTRPRTVFDAMTRADLLRRWWTPRSLGVELSTCESNPRVGGSYRFVLGHTSKPPMAFSGVYRDVVPGVRLVYTQVLEPMRHAGEGLITATFEAREGGTALIQRELYPSKEVLDDAIASGIERGMRETLEQLEALLPQLQREARG